MALEQLLNSICSKKHWQDTPVTCFVGGQYPYLFMRKLLIKLEQDAIIDLPRSRVQLASQDPKALLPLLQQTILGQASFFWLGALEENFSQKQKEVLLQGLGGYTGANRIAFFAEELPANASLPSFQLPVDISLSDAILLAQLFNPKVLDSAHKIAALKSLFQQANQISLNLFVGILDSFELVQAKQLEILLRYLAPTLPLSAELSELSQLFFKKDKLFFKKWTVLSEEYPPVFWLAFWGDQWWRAFHVVSLAQKKNIILAKKMAFKLPYSFINKDWQSYEPAYFQLLLKKLYTIDYKIKRGYTFCFFDHLYALHFFNAH